MPSAVLCGLHRISIHSPRARGDAKATGDALSALKFQSTPLIRGETKALAESMAAESISIHSPHARGDRSGASGARQSCDFNPLPSHEGRPPLPMRYDTLNKISIRAPLTRGDSLQFQAACHNSHFNPLPSHEGRQHKPPKIRPDLCQLTQQNHDTPLFGALQAPFCGAEPDIRGAKPTGKP